MHQNVTFLEMNVLVFFEYRKPKAQKHLHRLSTVLFIDAHAATAIHFLQISLYILRFEALHEFTTMRTICHKETTWQ